MPSKQPRYTNPMVIRLTAEMRQKLAEQAAAKGLRVSELVRELIKKETAKRKAQ